MLREIRVGDWVDQLRGIASNSVDVVCTSPPYWALRDYGVPGQLGLEASWRAHLDALKPGFVELRRVLKPTGSMWVNYGDTVATRGGPAKNLGGDTATARGTAGSQPANAPNRLAKDDPRKHKIGLHWRLRFMLNDDVGMISRGDVCWHKPNAMPLSMKDRVTPKYEMLFHLVKEPRYYFDLDAIRAPFAASSVARVQGASFWDQGGGAKDYASTGVQGSSSRETLERMAARLGSSPPSVPTSRLNLTGEGDPLIAAEPRVPPADPSAARDESGSVKGAPPGQRPRGPQRFNVRVRDAQRGVSDEKWGRLAKASPEEVAAYEEGGPGEDGQYGPMGANPGDVWILSPDEDDGVGNALWSIPNQPFAGAHFATYPPELVRRVIACSCPEVVCKACGAPWLPDYAVEYDNLTPGATPRNETTRSAAFEAEQGELPPGADMPLGRARRVARKRGNVPACECGAPGEPGVVLDPFAGAFTTPLVAAQMGRGFIAIELNPAYVEIGRRRIAAYMRPLSSFDVENDHA